MNLFSHGFYTLHSGEQTWWKIDCDALTNEDIATLAEMLHEVLEPFGSVDHEVGCASPPRCNGIVRVDLT